MARKPAVTYDDKTAFHALGLPDANDLALRADLMRKIVEIVKSRSLTHVEAAKLLHMDQPRVFGLMHGQITKFSTGRLLVALANLRRDVEVETK